MVSKGSRHLIDGQVIMGTNQQGIINWGGGHQSDVEKCDDSEETHLGRVVRLKFDLVS
jgi:hypothetical protein